MTGPIEPPVLQQAVVEIERHVAAGGWDQPPRLYALVETADLLAREPQLARVLGVPAGAVPVGALTPVEQEDIGSGPLDELLAGIAWPPEVLGAAVVQEVVVLPPSAEQTAPEGSEQELVSWAGSHPDRREVRLTVGVLRDGSRAAALRVRADDVTSGADAVPGAAEAPADGGPQAGDEVLVGPDLAPHLADALLDTLR